MAALYPVFAFPPDWTDPVAETLAWLTGVLQSKSAAEQRTKRRLTPRRTYQWNYLIGQADRTRMEMQLRAKGSDYWTVPLWHDASRLTTTLAANSSQVLVTTALREFVAGQPVVLWLDSENYEGLVINQVQSTKITFTSNTTRTWPAGTKLLSAMYGRLAAEPQSVRMGTDMTKGAVAFLGTAANPFTASMGTLPTYQGYYVVTEAPDYVEDVQLDWQRLTTVLDGDTGLTTITDTAGFGRAARSYRWFALGQAAAIAFRKLLYGLKGRLTPVWVPSFSDDIVLTEAVPAGATDITIRSIGYVDLSGESLQGREHVAFRMRDGTTEYRQIVSAAAGDTEETEVLTLDSGFAGDTEPSAILQTCFLSLCRQDADQIELSHPVDAAGVTRAATLFREAPDLRSIAYNCFDPGSPTSGVLLSDYDTRADVRYDETLPSLQRGNPMVRARIGFARNDGKRYFEGVWYKPDGLLFGSGLGICQLDATYADIWGIGADGVKAYIHGEYGSGHMVLFNGTVPFAVGGPLFQLGCYAFDLDAMLAWSRPTRTEKWNNDTGADPATGVGGIDISALTGPFLPVAGGGHNSDGAWSINLGQAPFAAVVPSGFVAWGAS